jgi:F-type H+-transporting ATPase subunit gamma
MPSLKDYRDRIASVKSTRKITSAMKMVAASKLKKAQEQAEAGQPYASAMGDMMARVSQNVVVGPNSPKLLIGTGSNKKHLLVAVTADRGLCGGFNGNLVRLVRNEIQRLHGEGKEVKLLCVGRKGYDFFKREFPDKILHNFTGIMGQRKINFADADQISQYILEQFEEGTFDICTLVYNEFKNVLTQKPTTQQLIPFAAKKSDDVANNNEAPKAAEENGVSAPYQFEPEENVILGQLLPKNLGVQIYGSLLDSAAGEQAARMTAMDNATRNAGDLINNLTLQYNRARQAYITKELIEIISGAEAV